MAKIKAEFSTKGFKELLKVLTKLSNRKIAKRILRKGVNAASTVVVRAVREEWPRDTGLSATAIDKKIIARPKDGIYNALIGMDKTVVGVSHNRKHVPARIDHLIENGWTMSNGKHVAPRAPLRKGFDAAKRPAIARLESKIKSDVEKEAMKGT